MRDETLAQNPEPTGRSKHCTKCDKTLNTSEFYKDKSKPDGASNQCRSCFLAYRVSELGVIAHIYRAQRCSSNRRNHPMPDYSNKELGLWLYDNGFFAMYCQWCWSGNEKNFKPSCDRINSLLPYSIDNLDLVTWEENNRRGHEDGLQAKGSGARRCFAVVQLKEGKEIARHHSLKSASRSTGLFTSNISQAIKNGGKCGGFRWVRLNSDGTMPEAGPDEHGKLTDSKVRSIHAERADGASTIALALKYGVSESCISMISRGKNWKHLGLPALDVKSQAVRPTKKICVNGVIFDSQKLAAEHHGVSSQTIGVWVGGTTRGGKTHPPKPNCYRL